MGKPVSPPKPVETLAIPLGQKNYFIKTWERMHNSQDVRDETVVVVLGRIVWLQNEFSLLLSTGRDAG